MRDLVVEMRFGSHLFGTATPASDVDYKAVYLPEGRDILLNRARDSIVESPPKQAGVKNSPGDVDREIYSLRRYFDLLAGGQVVAYDMLFAPMAAMTRPPAPLWLEIQANTDRLVSRRADNFLRYCRQQAIKFSLRGERVIAAREGLAALEAAEAFHGPQAKLAEAEAGLTAYVDAHGPALFLDLASSQGAPLRHLEICGRRMPFSGTIKNAREIVQRLVADYGSRARQAADNDGIDWKGMSHAVRIGREALELFGTGRINFPLACAPELLAIKRGQRPYEEVADLIEALLAEVEDAAGRSALPAEPDQTYIDDILVRAYKAKVLET
ncbi:MAG: nucleotidyltransferase domain-containing protein [Azospirillaceae bacterium]|nr:nucleotidyltransferase domain-containing protein [Azospirillaceae bacterium]